MSPDEARQYLEKLQRILAFARVSDVKMEEGSMRVDCNISVKPKDSEILGTPCEMNLSSFRAVARALPTNLIGKRCFGKWRKDS